MTRKDTTMGSGHQRGAGVTPFAPAGESPWAESFDAAIQRATTHNRLVMADFYTDGCRWCQELVAATYTDPKVVQALGQFVPVRIHAKKEGVDLANQYGVCSCPTILFIDPSGGIEARIGEYLPPGPFVDRLTQIAELRTIVPDLHARVQANPSDLEATGRLAAIYAERGDGGRALELLAQMERHDPQAATGHLAKAHNAVGDSFQDNQEFDQAISLFRRAAATSREAREIHHARVSIAVCSIWQQRMQEAIPELEAALAIPHVPEEMKLETQELLDWVKGRPRD